MNERGIYIALSCVLLYPKRFTIISGVLSSNTTSVSIHWDMVNQCMGPVCGHMKKIAVEWKRKHENFYSYATVSPIGLIIGTQYHCPR